MSGLFASLSIARAWEKVSSFLRVSSSAPSSSSVSQQEDLEELRKLERTMRRIRATLHDAEEHWNIREESSKLRLKELKDLAYDIEDVVDEYEYEVNRCEVLAFDRSARIPNTGKRKHQDEEDCLVDTGVVAVPHGLLLHARKITERFNEIVHYSEHLSLSENDGERRFAPDIRSLRHTSSVVFEKSILGREQDKDKIIDKLLSGEGRNVGNPVSVMAIVGMGGLGKTTLAQLVYNNPRMKQCFEKFAWVCVSEHFDVNTITRNTITSLTSVQCAYTEHADLQMKLANEVNERRVLLVLDDIWNERRDCWELFCRPLSTAKFCQIIVTARSEQVARLIQTMPCYYLSCLTSDESWSLFSQAAFIVEEESDIPTNLRNIGKRIVQKCKGLPLAIKTLGSMLRYETDERRWEDVLENDLWDFEQPRNEVLPALELSYKHMPVYLRRCFISLSLYPKDYRFQQSALSKLWKLLDLLPCDGKDDDDATGGQYLNELVQRSMLIYVLPTASYCMHDLIHDLACFLAGDEFYRLEQDTHIEIPQNIRYISIHKYIPEADISVFPHSVRAIIVLGELGNMNQTMIPEALFSNCKKLRVLDISHSKRLQMVLPDYMGNLKLLRRLSLRGLPTMPMPLQPLDPLDKVSVHIENLVLSGIGLLTSLRSLSDIRITKSLCSFNIRELRNVNQVRELRINGLSNIRHIEHAYEAQLQRKKLLQSLHLNFTGVEELCPCGLPPETIKIPHDQLLDSLRPHHNLHKLSISGYNSAIYPSWLGEPSFFRLTRIYLCGGRSKYLEAVFMNSVEDIGGELFRQCAGDKYFPSLTDLSFEFMSEWSEWSAVDAGVPPCLKELSLFMCEKLSSLPLGPLRCLVVLTLSECHSIAMLPALLALRELKIAGCSSLTEIPILPSLCKLNISKCRNLSSIGLHPSFNILQLHHSSNPSGSAVSSLPKLTAFTLGGCPNLSAVCYLPSLTTLELMFQMRDELLCSLLNDLPSLNSLEISLSGSTSIHLKQKSLPSLKRLCLTYCFNLQYCDGLPSLTSLEHLEVRQCPNLPIYNLHPSQLKSLII